MKTIAKVLEAMLTKPATPTWDVSELTPRPAVSAAASTVPGLGPVGAWSWGG
jgi:hypothetical protein